MIKRAVLHACRALGLFRLARRRLRGRLLILAYHGVSQADEHQWRAKLFMSPPTFERRLAYLAGAGVPVVSLGDGLERLERPGAPWAVALTFDDGFHNYATVAAPRLDRHGMPATVYVASYYAEHPRWPVFDLIVDYALWRCPTREAPGALIGEQEPLRARTREERDRSVERIYAHAERARLDGAGKEALARALADALGFPYERHAADGLLCLMSDAELRGITTGRTEVQLHTHRHHIPSGDGALAREIDDNRAVLARMGVVPPPLDFCYPSGVWDRAMWPVLERAGVRSATTCEPGAARPDSPRYALPRFLDSESVSQIEFEAWASGFMPWAREALGRGPRAR